MILQRLFDYMFGSSQKQRQQEESYQHFHQLRLDLCRRAEEVHFFMKRNKAEVPEEKARLLYRLNHLVLSKIPLDNHLNYFASNLFGLPSFPKEQLLEKIMDRSEFFEGKMNLFATDCAIRNIIVAVRDFKPEMEEDDYNYVYGALSYLEAA